MFQDVPLTFAYIFTAATILMAMFLVPRRVLWLKRDPLQRGYENGPRFGMRFGMWRGRLVLTLLGASILCFGWHLYMKKVASYLGPSASMTQDN
ncbi:MAG: hypothetical protein JST51_15505 [Armatimonadetes bacterium]|nr:hypothetical protein [Armatimonadota bacterium]